MPSFTALTTATTNHHHHNHHHSKNNNSYSSTASSTSTSIPSPKYNDLVLTFNKEQERHKSVVTDLKRVLDELKQMNKQNHNRSQSNIDGDHNDNNSNDKVISLVEKNIGAVNVPTTMTTTTKTTTVGGSAGSGLSQCSDFDYNNGGRSHGYYNNGFGRHEKIGTSDEDNDHGDEIMPVFKNGKKCTSYAARKVRGDDVVDEEDVSVARNVDGTDYDEDESVPVSGNFYKITNMSGRGSASVTSGSDDEIMSVGINAHKSTRTDRKVNSRGRRTRRSTMSSRGRNSGVVNRGGVTKSKSKRKTTEKIPGLSRYWTDSEHFSFLLAIVQFGYKDLKGISEYVETRNQTQVRTHSQKYFMRIVRECQRLFPFGVGGHCPHYSGVDGEQLVCSPCRNIEIKPENKYSVPKEYGLGLLCLVGEDTEEAVKESMGWADRDYYG